MTIFDEPAQQNINKQDDLKFYDIAAEACKSWGQIIIAATDEDKSVREKARLLNMNVIDFGQERILRLLEE